ncbi:MAG TPA: autotransporter domain-containing protein [Bradyrhizobium sp.]|nr:autotransporter domain-containing protein [Bradyrhizobium sp.]
MAAVVVFAATLTMSSNAWAVCTTSGAVVTCSGTTTAVGTAFGTGTEDNLTINVQNAATVSGTGAGGNGFNIRNNDTLNNSGTVGGTDQGILAGSNLTVNNSLSTSTIVGTNIAGIKATSINVTNFGSITGGAAGVASTVGALTIDNRSGATISGGSVGATAAAGATVTNAGTISSTGTEGVTVATGDSSFTNSGTITSSGNSGFGIFSQGSGTVTVSNNGGTISNTGTGGFGIFSASGNINITSNSGTIQGAVAIQGGATITVNNLTGGTITGLTSEAIGTSGRVNLINAGTVSGSNATTISAGIANITNSGTISGSNSALGTIFVSNSGSIINNSVNGNISAMTGTATQTEAIFASLTTVTVSNSGTIQATGTNAIGIAANGMTVTNNAGATISGTLDGVNMQAGLTSSIANTGTISGGRSALRLGSNASVVNTGTGLITGTTGIVFRDPTATNTPVVNGSVFNSGTITGTGGTAINFALTPGSGPFTLTLGPGSIINGNVLGTGGDLFQLGGTTGSDTFNVSNIGAAQQYRGFTTFDKIDGSTWFLTGTGTQTWSVSGGVLGGTATIGGLNVLSGATLMPGNGTAGTSMAVAGNLAFQSGAQYLVQISPATSSFTSVTGTATLGGATVNANFAAGSYIAKKYTIVTAGNIGGTFNSAVVSTNLPSSLSSSLSYDAHDVFLNLAVNFTAPGALNGNQQAVANAITNAFNAGGAVPVAFATLTPAGFTQATGETATGSQQTTFDAMMQFLGVMTDPFIAGRGGLTTPSSGASPFAEEDVGTSAYAANGTPRSKSERDAYAAMYRKAPQVADPFAQRWSVWTAGFGGSQTTDGNTALGSNTATSRIAGTAVGADYRISPFTLAGFALAGGGTNFSVANGGTGRSDLFQAGAFILHNVGPAYVSGALAYGWQDITTDRIVTIAGVDHLHAEFNANAFSGRAEGGYRFVAPWTYGVGITPYAAAQFTTFDLPAYAEQALSGASTFALAYGPRDVTDTRSELGIRTDRSYAMKDTILTLRGRLAWAHDFDPDRNIAATFQSLPGASFVVNGAAQASDSALVTASAEMRWLNGWSAAATFEGEFSDVTRSYAGKGIVRYSW